MKKFAILALAVLVAIPASAAGVTISGYIDIGYIAAESDFAGSTLHASGSTNGTIGANDGFSLNEVNLDLASQLTNDVSAFVSIDFNSTNSGANANGRPADGIDYAYVDIANPGPFDLNVRVGRIPSVVGIEQRASESNQTNFINLSLLSPVTVGSVDGAAIYGSFSPVNYALAISNADVMSGLTGGSLATEYTMAPLIGVTNAGRPGNSNGTSDASGLDNNNAFALSGRLGVVPVEGLEVGVSYSTNKYAAAGASSDANQLNRRLLGVDASYAYGPFGLKAEWVSADEDQAQGVLQGVDFEFRGYYVEGTYDVSSKYSAGVRYGRVQTEARSADRFNNDVSTVSIAGVYRMADNVSLKAEYDMNKEHVIAGNRRDVQRPGDAVGLSPISEIDNDVFALSLVGSF